MKQIKLFSMVLIFASFFVVKNAQASVDFNCYCLNGSLIPTYYPLNTKLNTADFDSCNQECANVGAKYFSFSTVAHIGTTLVSKAPSSPATPPAAPASNTGANGQIDNSAVLPGNAQNGGIIACGRPGQSMCTLCDLIRGMRIIIDYLMKIAIGVALLAMSIGGVMYVVSAGDTGLIDKAKGAIKNAAIGFVIIFAGFLIINTTIEYLGARKTVDASGATTSMFGIKMTGWGNFDCTAPLSGTR
jgi:hypothetical protein